MMAQKVIFAEQAVDGFAVGEMGVFEKDFAFGEGIDAFTIVVGDTYKVMWDDKEYVVTAQDASLIFAEGAVALGNLSSFELIGNNEPFVIGWTQYGFSFFVMDGDVSDSHKVGIYQDAAETPAIILKDRDGNDQQYDGGLPVRLQLSDGTTKDFVAADSVPEEVAASVELDFSGGDMEVTPDEGKVFSRVAIPTPANLIPANIAEGVDIAGIIGTLAAGGGGGSAVFASSFFTGTGGVETVNHKLGVIPDIVAVFASKIVSGTTNFICSIGYSSAMIAKGYRGYVGCDVMEASSVSAGIDTAASDAASLGYIRNATESTFQVGGTTLKTDTKKYLWIAIGGLT